MTVPKLPIRPPGVPKTLKNEDAKLQRRVLDWIETVKPVAGDILVLRVPSELWVKPGTAAEDVTPEQESTMREAHHVLGTVLANVRNNGIQLAGAAILSEDMTLEDLPPPPGWAKQPTIQVPQSRILLPPGTKI